MQGGRLHGSCIAGSGRRSKDGSGARTFSKIFARSGNERRREVYPNMNTDISMTLHLPIIPTTETPACAWVSAGCARTGEKAGFQENGRFAQVFATFPVVSRSRSHSEKARSRSKKARNHCENSGSRSENSRSRCEKTRSHCEKSRSRSKKARSRSEKSWGRCEKTPSRSMGLVT